MKKHPSRQPVSFRIRPYSLRPAWFSAMACMSLALWLALAGTASAAYVYVGSYNVADGQVWTTDPLCYTAQEAAALVFGGAATDYAISVNANTTDSSTITFSAWVDGYGDPTYINSPGPQNFKSHTNYDTFGAFSAFVADHVDNRFYSTGTGPRYNYVWRLVASPPTVTTLAATAVTPASATLNGSVNANGSTTTVTFEYGLTTGYGTTVSATPGSVGGFSSVSAAIAGLTQATTYHFRTKGSSAGGLINGADMTFITAGTITSGAGNAATGTTAGGASVGQWGSVRSGMVLSESGAVAYRGYLLLSGGVTVDNFQGIWNSPDGSYGGLYLVARTGDAAPDTGGALFDVLPFNPVVNNSGLTTFISFLRINTGSPLVDTTTDSGVWSELGGAGLHKVLREGETITGGTVTGVAPSAWLATSNAGHTVFNVKLNGSSSAMVRATISGASASLATLVQQGGAAPDVGGGTQGTFDSFLGNTTDPRMDAVGDIAFLSQVLPGGSGIWYQAIGSSLLAVARTGEATPGLAGDTFAGFERPTLSAGSIAFRAFLTNNGQSVWRGNPANPASMTVLAKTNDTGVAGIPAGSKLWSLWSPYSNASGRVAFRVSLMDAGLNETRAIVTDTSGTLTVIAKVGDAAPGLAGETFTSFDHPVIGDNGQTAFIAATNAHVGLWRQAPGGGALSLVLTVGDTLNTGNGPETVSQIIIPGTSSADRLNEVRSVSATGRILVHVTYASGDTGAYLTPY